jgi:predicted DNA-binding protein (MmcQ/YjbR family)
MSFPHATEQVQWGNDLLYKIGGKMFAAMNLEPAELTTLGFKCDPEVFAELIEREGVKPDKYIGRYHWVNVTSLSSFKKKELEDLISASYQMVYDKLPRKMKLQLAEEG